MVDDSNLYILTSLTGQVTCYVSRELKIGQLEKRCIIPKYERYRRSN